MGKLGLVQAGFAAGAEVVVAVSLVVSLLTLFSMTKIWGGVFWGVPEAPGPIATDRPSRPLPLLMVGATAATVALSVLIAVFAGDIYDLSHRAAVDLRDPTAYIDAVLGR